MALNTTFKLWECLTMGLLSVDLAVTLYGVGSEFPDAVLPVEHSESIVALAFSELVLLMQLLHINLPVYPASEFETLGLAKKLRDQTFCPWIGGLIGTQGAQFAASVPRLEETELRTFGIFLIPVAAAVGWKWRRLRRRLQQARRQDEAALIAQVFRVWTARE